MAFVLPVHRGMQTVGVSLNVNNRIDIYNAAGTAFEVVNTPDTTPNLGGKFPAYDSSGTVYPITYTSASSPDIIEELIAQTPGDAVQGGWTR